MIKIRVSFLYLLVFGFFILFSLRLEDHLHAAETRVTINVVASNATNEEGKKMPIRQDLPREVKKEDVFETGGMDVKYDEEKDLYYLYAEVDIDPHASKSFNVVIRDVWRIPEADLSFLKEQADERLKKLVGTESHELGEVYRNKIVTQIDEIINAQNAQKGDVRKRMELFRVDKEKMKDIRHKVTLLDDFVGESKQIRTKEDNKSIRFIIEAKNPSETESYDNAEITRYLPQGVTPQQVEDSQGFEIKFDLEKKLYYLTNTVNFDPGESKKFEVIISNQNISDAQLDKASETERFTTKLVGTGYEKIGAYIALEISKNIEEIKTSQNNAVTAEDRIATHAHNIEKFDVINQNIEQLRTMVEAADKAKQKKVTEIIKTVTPDVATTWKIIYATIGFLVTIAVSFYFLWWGQVKVKQNKTIDVLKTPEKEK